MIAPFKARGIPYQRLIREALERAVAEGRLSADEGTQVGRVLELALDGYTYLGAERVRDRGGPGAEALVHTDVAG